ncbi:MAG: hypothetical protein KY456_16360 [Chloroflexi bacterium]|nr:hypothetical protein [Chloroflexota bacterium]
MHIDPQHRLYSPRRCFAIPKPQTAVPEIVRDSWKALCLERATRREAERELHDAGIWRSPIGHYSGHLTIAAVVAVLLVAILAVANRSPDAPDSQGVISDLAAGILGAGALWLGLQQFRLARNEVSLDKFYDRLDITNCRLEASADTRSLVDCWEENGQDNERTFARKMYVYRELDNLEYAIAKYRIGFMQPDNAYRALRTFRSRCSAGPDFCTIARRAVVDKPEVDKRGYDNQTIAVVKYACDSAEPFWPAPSGSQTRPLPNP